MKIDRSRYKGKLLLRSLEFPMERSMEVIDGWLEALKDGNLAARLSPVEKRMFVDDCAFESGGANFRAKYYRTATLKRRLEALIFRPESQRNFNAAIRAARAGLLTARPLCVWMSRRLGLHDWSVLFMEDLGDLKPLPDYMDGLDPRDSAVKSKLAGILALQLAKLHDEKIYVHDPAKNILVREENGDLRLVFIDFDTVRWRMAVSKVQVARVLRHCIRPPSDLEMFSRDEIGIYVREYLKARGLAAWFEDVFPLV